MQAGDRVRWRANVDDVAAGDVGTVAHVSPFGYVRVAWDDGNVGTFAPVTAAERLERLEGVAALPRHDWLDADICGACGVDWSSDRQDEPCPGAGER